MSQTGTPAAAAGGAAGATLLLTSAATGKITPIDPAAVLAVTAAAKVPGGPATIVTVKTPTGEAQLGVTQKPEHVGRKLEEAGYRDPNAPTDSAPERDSPYELAGK